MVALACSKLTPQMLEIFLSSEEYISSIFQNPKSESVNQPPFLVTRLMDLEIVAINRERKHIFENHGGLMKPIYHLKDLVVQVLNLFTFLKTVHPTQSYGHLTRFAFVSRLLTNSPLGVAPFPACKIGKECLTWHCFLCFEFLNPFKFLFTFLI